MSAKSIRAYQEHIGLPMVNRFFKSLYGYLRAIYRADPFQRQGIPCWKSFSGPLDPVEPYSGGFADNE